MVTVWILFLIQHSLSLSIPPPPPAPAAARRPGTEHLEGLVPEIRHTERGHGHNKDDEADVVLDKHRAEVDLHEQRQHVAERPQEEHGRREHEEGAQRRGRNCDASSWSAVASR